MSKKTVIITRPRSQSNRFKTQLINAGLNKNQCVVSPIIEIKKIQNHPKLNASTIILFTSENAILNWNCKDKAKYFCYCVGQNTTKTARKMGLNATFLGNDVETFIKNFPLKNYADYHYLRGKDVTLDLIGQLRSNGLKINETIVYEQVSKKLNNTAKMLLKSDNKTVITIFSKIAAATILNELKNTKFLNTEFLCLSANIEKIIRKGGIEMTKVPKQPTTENLIDNLVN